MQFHFDIWLLIISLLTSSIVALITFNFVDRLYTAAVATRKGILAAGALVIGTCLWANHILISFAFELDPGETRNLVPSMTFLAWSFAVFTAVIILNTASKKQSGYGTAFGAGVLSAFSMLAMYYFDTSSIHGFGVIHPEPYATTVSVIFTTGVISCSILLLSWLKTYVGKNSISIKLISALIIALNIIAVHAAFDQPFSHDEVLSADNIPIYAQFMGVILALAFLSFVLIAFVLILFYEKHGKALLKHKFLNATKQNELGSQELLDTLTKLPNRGAFQQHLDSAAKRSARSRTTFALAYIDLDHFKPVNDQYGHHVGDAVLSMVATRLNAAVRGCDFVARIGGDEFVAVLEEIGTDEDITPIAERIVKSIKEAFFISGGITIEISCSVGIAIYPKDGDLDKLMTAADAAMYKAKEGGKNQFRFYDADIESASDQMLELQRDLCLAIEKNEFILHYQPKIDCKTLAPVGVEALLRWNHPLKGETLPKVFLEAAERFGLINEIGNLVVDESCRTIVCAKQQGVDLNVSINLSSQQFRNPNLVKDILKTIKFYDLDANNLTFEIKETIAIKNQEQFKLLLGKFKVAGIKLVLDDFGLHPISLAYLQDLDVSEIKLDRSFVKNVSRNKTSKALIEAVIKLAHALNLAVVAEGVETEEQREAIMELGCDYMQGYLFCKPVAQNALFELFKELQTKQIKMSLGHEKKFSPAEYGVIAA